MSGIDTGRTIPPKLGLWETIYISYSSYFKNFRDVWDIVWLWIVVVVPLLGVSNYLRLSSLAAMFNPGAASGTHMSSVGYLALTSFSTILSVLAGTSIAVAWHRRLILDERPAVSASNVMTAGVWRYIGVGIATFFIAILPLLGLILLFLLWSYVSRDYAGPPRSLMFLLVGIAAVVVMLRFSFLLPARAVGNLDLTFKQSWKITRGNTWRLFWGFVACAALPIFAAQILLAVSIGFLGFSNFFGIALLARLVAISITYTTCYFLIAPIGIGFLSRAYYVLYELNLPD